MAQNTAPPAPYPATIESAPAAAEGPEANLSVADDDSEQWTREPATPGAEPLKYSIERRGGQVKVSGAGVSNVSAGSPAVTTGAAQWP